MRLFKQYKLSGRPQGKVVPTTLLYFPVEVMGEVE